MSVEQQKIKVGISCGDLNGIGLEIIIKAFADHRILEFCTPIIFANTKAINFYRKLMPSFNFSFFALKEIDKPNTKQVNVYNSWEEDVQITPGTLNETGGKYALKSLFATTKALKEGYIQAMVTLPIHKKNVYSDDFKYTGHTPFLKDYFASKEVLMFMVADNIKVGLLTEHVPIAEVSKHLTKEKLSQKLWLMHQSLTRDFGVERPKIAVLGLNPHAGDEGLIGQEEEKIIKPAIKEIKQKVLAYGPYSSDAFFAKGQYEKFDAVLALYHDQGLIPFKSLSIGDSTNYTAGLPVVRTSPDHGTAFDIAGKGLADHVPFLSALYRAIDIYQARHNYAEARQNPMKKLSAKMLANSNDEKLEEIDN